MPCIVLNEEQAKIVVSALEPIQVRDPCGKLLGHIPPTWTAEDIAEAKRILKSQEQWHTTEQVLQCLHALDDK